MNKTEAMEFTKWLYFEGYRVEHYKNGMLKFYHVDDVDDLPYTEQHVWDEYLREKEVSMKPKSVEYPLTVNDCTDATITP